MNSMPSSATTTTSNTTAMVATNIAKKTEEPESVSSAVAAVDKGEPPSAASVSAIELGLIEEDIDKNKEAFISASMEDDHPCPATVFCIRLKQPEENLRHKMSVPELCRNFSAVAWCGKLNLIACAAETCARLPSYNVKPPFWIPIHVVNPERPTESAIFNVAAGTN
ncbi:Mediator of RNA polymerase II transcription subunit 16 [Nymphaea thermarum]|nr:Mediator of RNA polymerase II transcription subunit 16 [Nymphaea thermarum]